MKFKVTYASGVVEETTTDDETIEAFVNAKFGSSYEAFVDNGGAIETDADPVPKADVVEADGEGDDA